MKPLTAVDRALVLITLQEQEAEIARLIRVKEPSPDLLKLQRANEFALSLVRPKPRLTCAKCGADDYEVLAPGQDCNLCHDED